MIQGSIKTEYTHITDALLNDPGLELDVLCVEDPSKTNPASRFSRVYQCITSITIYGPISAFADVGGFFQDEGIYLQDPVDAGRRVKYFNPHRLSSVDLATSLWTSDLQDAQHQLSNMKERKTESAALEIFESTEDLAEASQPYGIRTLLERHCSFIRFKSSFRADTLIDTKNRLSPSCSEEKRGGASCKSLRYQMSGTSDRRIRACRKISHPCFSVAEAGC